MKQDSVSQQVQQLEQRAKIAESLAFSKNAEAQAAQRKLDELQAQFDRETTRLRVAQHKELTEARAVLLAAIEDAQLDLDAKNEALDGVEQQLRATETKVKEATDRLAIALQGIESAQNELAEVRRQQIRADDAVAKANQKRTDLERDNSVLATEKMSLQDATNRLRVGKEDLVKQIDDLVTDFAAQKTLKEDHIEQLNRQIVDLTAEIEQKTEEDRVTRASLAEWQTRLEAQDQNLRVRELKVAEGESKIVRNANLLNL